MRKKQIFVLLVVFAFINVSIISLALTTTAKSSNGVRPLEEMALMDLTHENFIERDSKARNIAGQAEPIITSGGTPVSVGVEIIVSVSDDYLGESYDETFVVIEDGTNGIILIEKDAFEHIDPVTGEFIFANPNGVWRPEDRISPAQLSYLLDAFDTNIYEIVTGIFGNLKPRGDEDQKVWVLIHNIRDASYYDPAQTSYIAGYFSSGENADNDKNMFHIDSYDWQNRVGPDGARPHLYEGTFAHEFEHMVHFDIDPDEPSWVDEGLADLAGYLCGYGHSSGHIANYMVYHPFTALTFWGGALEDYGVSYLFALYLYEKFGKEAFITDLVNETENGIIGIQNTLDAWGHDISFDELYDAFTIAVYFDDLEPGNPYGFDTLDIGTEDTWGYSINYAITNMWFKPNPFKAPIAFSNLFGPSQPYTAHYYPFGSSSKAALVYLEGDILAGPGSNSPPSTWYSDVGAWAWRSIYQTFDLKGYSEIDELTLQFSTYYEIEDYWDFGYVEVFDGVNWTTLADNEGYTDILDPFAQDNPNVPEDREPRAYAADGKWNAFTGLSGGWVDITMDLSSFAGKEIELHFRTWQDGAFTYQMMYIDDINITANGASIFFDPADGEALWSKSGDDPEDPESPTWYVFSGLKENNWQGTVIATFKEPQKNPTGNRWTPSELRELLWTASIPMTVGISPLFAPIEVQFGTIVVPTSPTRNEHSTVLIVSNRADHILPASYIVAIL